jgi:hypothetical protein
MLTFDIATNTSRPTQTRSSFMVISADDNDAHILDAIFKSRIERVYFSVYPPSNDTNAIDGHLAKYKARNGSKVEYALFDATTASVWGAA